MTAHTTDGICIVYPAVDLDLSESTADGKAVAVPLGPTASLRVNLTGADSHKVYSVVLRRLSQSSSATMDDSRADGLLQMLTAASNTVFTFNGLVPGMYGVHVQPAGTDQTRWGEAPLQVTSISIGEAKTIEIRIDKSAETTR
ncbi:MAG TPA: hypothetical protein VG675_22460 [Bryobacteraceae bacterium]|nr:hypothetical protein [Bryobacteraceae bacterium]